jgi:hypothetical protein
VKFLTLRQKFVNDFFGVVSFLRHGSDLITWLFTTFYLDQFFGLGHEPPARGLLEDTSFCVS